MGGNTLDMTKGSAWKLIVQFAVPVFLSQVFQQLYNTADALIVGRFLGDEALAAVSASGPLIFLLISFFTGLSMGAGVTISRYFGAGDYDRVSRAIHTDVMLGLLSGVILTVVGVWLTPTFLRWMGTAPEVLPDAIAYFRYYFIGVLAVVMYNMCKSIMNALGDSKRPLYYLIISSLTNIVLDLLFIGAFHWGVWAAAVATTISQAVSMILCMIHLMKKGTIYQVELKKAAHRPRNARPDYPLRSAVRCAELRDRFCKRHCPVQHQLLRQGRHGGLRRVLKLEGFAFLPVTSFTMALTTFVGQNLGAGLHDRAKKGSRFGIIASVVIAEIIGVTMYLLAPQLVALFSPTPEVVELGTRQMRTTALFFCLLAYSHAIASICRGAGKAFVPMVIMLLFWCVVRIAYITIVMGIVHEIQYIYMAYPITWSLSSIVYFLYYHFSDWVHGFEKKPAKS